MTMPTIYISEFDFNRLHKSLMVQFDPLLHTELQRAEIISDVQVPPDLITLDSIVQYRVEEEDAEKESMLVLPLCPEEQDQVLSVYSPVGMALMGLQTGESIEWDTGDGKKTLTVLDLKYQPEAAGDLHPLTFYCH